MRTFFRIWNLIFISKIYLKKSFKNNLFKLHFLKIIYQIIKMKKNYYNWRWKASTDWFVSRKNIQDCNISKIICKRKIKKNFCLLFFFSFLFFSFLLFSFPLISLFLLSNFGLLFLYLLTFQWYLLISLFYYFLLTISLLFWNLTIYYIFPLIGKMHFDIFYVIFQNNYSMNNYFSYYRNIVSINSQKKAKSWWN